MGLGAPEILIVLVVLLLLFGGSQLPKLARSLGQASTEFRRGIRARTEPEGDGADTDTEDGR